MHAVFFNSDGDIRSGWKAAGFVVLVGLLGFLVSALLKLLAPGKGSAAATLIGNLVPTLMVLAATALCLRLEGRPLSSIGLRFNRRWLAEFALGTAGGVLLLVLVALAVRATGAFRWEHNPAGGAVPLLSAAWMFLGVSCFEELTFRGYPFQRLVHGALGEKGTLALFAIFFGLAHWGNPGMAGAAKAWATLNIALAALLLGLGWIRTGSLALPIGIHLGWNWCQGPLLGFKVSGTEAGGFWRPVLKADSPGWLHGGAFGLEGTLACAILCAGACLLVYFWKPGRKTPFQGPA
jgi:membrane protease YdiL (CAAX protease family)